MLHLLVRLTRRATRWILRNHRLNLDCDSLISQYAEPVEIFLSELPILQKEQWKGLWRKESDAIVASGVDSALSERLACSDSMFISMGVVNIALSLRVSVQQVADVYFTLGEYLSLDWFMAAIVELQPENRWQDLARETYVDDLESQRRRLTTVLCRLKISQADPMESWQQQQRDMIRRWHLMVADLRNSPNPDFAMISVALKELLNLVMASVDGGQ
jgi:glutamate dehydrogenase